MHNMQASSKAALLKRFARGAVLTGICMLCHSVATASLQQERAPFLSSIGEPVQVAHLRVNLISANSAIQPGTSIDAGLHFVLDKGWHIYWKNAGDSGEPPAIDWKLPPGLTAGQMQFPVPRRLPLGPLMDFGYENEVVFPISLKAEQNLRPPLPVQLHAHVSWLVCREVCIPGKADLNLALTIAGQRGDSDPAAEALISRFKQRLPQPLPVGSRAVFQTSAKGFTLYVSNLPGAGRSGLEFFPIEENQIDNPAPQPVKASSTGLEISLRKDENLQSAVKKLTGVIGVGDGGGYLIEADPGTIPEISSSSWSGLLVPLRFAVLAFAGGVLLNLMPCVFPVLFIKGLFLLESSGQARNRFRALGAAYALGILVSFWAVVAVLIGLRATGRHLGWGFQFQSPAFVAVIALLLFFMGLSLGGMFDLGLRLTSAGSGLAAKKGYAGSFFTGVLATVVATPCTAPLMGTAVGFALSQPAAMTLIIFTALALGLAAPYVLLTLNPAWTALLPRPGAWMETLKQATAVPIFATVIWLVWLFTQSAGVNALPGLMTAFLMLATAGWLLARWPARPIASACAAVIVLLAAALPIYVVEKLPRPELTAAEAENTSVRAVANKQVWEPFSQAAIENYQALGRPIFVDFTANWCLSCQVNERLVLDRSDVQEKLHDSGAVLVRADWSRHDDSIAHALNTLGRSGIPTYVIYKPGAPAQILPEILTPGIVIEALNQLGRN